MILAVRVKQYLRFCRRSMVRGIGCRPPERSEFYPPFSGFNHRGRLRAAVPNEVRDECCRRVPRTGCTGWLVDARRSGWRLLRVAILDSPKKNGSAVEMGHRWCLINQTRSVIRWAERLSVELASGRSTGGSGCCRRWYFLLIGNYVQKPCWVNYFPIGRCVRKAEIFKMLVLGCGWLVEHSVRRDYN